MSFCPNCGHEVYAGMNFCPGCGRNLADLVLDPEPAPEPDIPQSPPVQPLGAYQAVLLSDGDCSKSEAAELLEDLLGYEKSDAKNLVKSAPAAVAENLTESQARYLAQAMNEYGMEAAVYGPNGYVDLGSCTRSVFDDDGNFLGDVVRTLAVLSVANRVRRIERWMAPPPPRSWFAPRPHRRRSFLAPPPPAPRRAAPPPPPRRSAPPPPARHPALGPGPRREPPRPAGPGRNSAGRRNPGPGKGPGGPSRGPGGRGPGGPGKR